MKRRRVVAVLLLAGVFAAGPSLQTRCGRAPLTHPQRPSTRCASGTKVAIPAIRQRCSVEEEGRAANLFCSRPRRPHHQLTIFRDRILVYKVGDPEHPAWSGKP
jgi:hypothetical protein